MNVTLTDAEADRIALQVLDNYPEAGAGATIQAHDGSFWQKREVLEATEEARLELLKDAVYIFIDTEEDKTYSVTRADIARGVKLYYTIGPQKSRDFTLDNDNWDANNDDQVVQCALLGDIIYG